MLQVVSDRIAGIRSSSAKAPSSQFEARGVQSTFPSDTTIGRRILSHLQTSALVVRKEGRRRKSTSAAALSRTRLAKPLEFNYPLLATHPPLLLLHHRSASSIRKPATRHPVRRPGSLLAGLYSILSPTCPQAAARHFGGFVDPPPAPNPLNSRRSATRLRRSLPLSSIVHRTSRFISRPTVCMSVCQE